MASRRRARSCLIDCLLVTLLCQGLQVISSTATCCTMIGASHEESASCASGLKQKPFKPLPASTTAPWKARRGVRFFRTAFGKLRPSRMTHHVFKCCKTEHDILICHEHVNSSVESEIHTL